MVPLAGLVSRTMVHLRYGYLWVALGSKGLKLILLSIKDNGFYENSYTLGGGHGPPAPTKSAPVYSEARGFLCVLGYNSGDSTTSALTA